MHFGDKEQQRKSARHSSISASIDRSKVGIPVDKSPNNELKITFVGEQALMVKHQRQMSNASKKMVMANTAVH
jgi:hypothetical protein